MAQILTTGDENAGQVLRVPVPGRASPLAVVPTPGNELPLVPLSTVLFLDGGTTTPVANQNGSIATPFSTGAAALATAVQGETFMVVPAGAYDIALTAGQDFTFIGLGSQAPALPPLRAHLVATITDATGRFQNALVQFAVVQAAGAPALFAINCFLTGSFSGPSSCVASECTVDTVVGDATSITLDDCILTGDVTCSGTLTIRNLRSADASLTLTATTINVDSVSLRALVFAGVTFVGTVTGYEGTVMSFGAGAATGGQFIDQGSRANPLSFAAEDTVRFFIGRRCVVCALKVFSNVNMTFTARKNAADTALAVTVNGGEGANRNTFIEFGEDETLDIAITAAAPGQAICTLIIV